MLNSLGELYKQHHHGRPASRQTINEIIIKTVETNRKSTERAKNPTGEMRLQGMDKLQRQLTGANKGVVKLQTQASRQLNALSHVISHDGLETRKELRVLRLALDRYAKAEKHNREQEARQTRQVRQTRKLSVPKHVRETYAHHGKHAEDLRFARERAASRVNHHSMHQPRSSRGRFISAHPDAAHPKGGSGLLGLLGGAGGAAGGWTLWKSLKSLRDRALGRNPAKDAAKNAEKEVEKKAGKSVAKDVGESAAKDAVENAAKKKAFGFMGGMLFRKGLTAYTLYDAVKNGPTNAEEWNKKQEENDSFRESVESVMRDYLPSALFTLKDDPNGQFSDEMRLKQWVIDWWNGKKKDEDKKEEGKKDANAANDDDSLTHRLLRFSKRLGRWFGQTDADKDKPPEGQAKADPAKAAQDTAAQVGAVYVKALNTVADKSLATIEEKTTDTQKSLVASFAEVKKAEDRKDTQDKIVKPIDAVKRSGPGGDGGPSPSPAPVAAPNLSPGPVNGPGGGPQANPSPDNASPAPTLAQGQGVNTPRIDTQVDNSGQQTPEGPAYDFGRNVRPSPQLGGADKPGFSVGIVAPPSPDSDSGGGATPPANFTPRSPNFTPRSAVNFTPRPPASPDKPATPDKPTVNTENKASAKLSEKELNLKAWEERNPTTDDNITKAERAYAKKYGKEHQDYSSPLSIVDQLRFSKKLEELRQQNGAVATPDEKTPAARNVTVTPQMPTPVSPAKSDGGGSKGKGDGGGDDDQNDSGGKGDDDDDDDDKGKGDKKGKSSVKSYKPGSVSAAPSPVNTDGGGDDDQSDAGPSASPGQQQQTVDFADIPSQTDDYMLAAMHSTDTV